MGTPAITPVVQIEAVQTVTPKHMTPTMDNKTIPGSGQLTQEALQSRIRLVLYYKSPLEDKCGWTFVGQLKESLNVALPEMAVIASRVRRREEDGELEIRMNDAGVRLVQGRAVGGMREFVDRGLERQLVYWVDVDYQNPHLCPLFYVQLTAFEGEGYSIGVSSSLLVTNPLSLAGILKTWSRIHRDMTISGAFLETPLFHLSNFKRHLQTNAHNTTSNHNTINPTSIHNTKTFMGTRREQLPTDSSSTTRPMAFLTTTSGDVEVSDKGVGVERGEKVVWADYVRVRDEIKFEDNFPVEDVKFEIECLDQKGVVVIVPELKDGIEWTSAVVFETTPLV